MDLPLTPHDIFPLLAIFTPLQDQEYSPPVMALMILKFTMC
jgi:hypothetical protein